MYHWKGKKSKDVSEVRATSIISSFTYPLSVVTTKGTTDTILFFFNFRVFFIFLFLHGATLKV